MIFPEPTRCLARTMQTDTSLSETRIDKWLWAARFFKTRALATEAVKGGKVDINGHRAKAAKNVRPGDMLKIHKAGYEYIVEVQLIAKTRGSATIAATLYTETEESRAKREALALQMKAEHASAPRSLGKPSKRNRRDIIKFTRT